MACSLREAHPRHDFRSHEWYVMTDVWTCIECLLWDVTLRRVPSVPSTCTAILICLSQWVLAPGSPVANSCPKQTGE
jgi:hypothetical protein